MHFSKLLSCSHVKIIEKRSGIKLWIINNFFIIISWTTNMGSVTYVNTQLTRPSGQPSAFTVIQVSRCDNYTLDWYVQAPLLWEMESKKKKKCVSQDLGLGSRDKELQEIGSSRDLLSFTE